MRMVKHLKILEQSESKRKEIATGYSFPILFMIGFMIGVMLFVGGLGNGACNAAGNSQEIRVGSELDFPPYAFVDESGQVTGFSVELIKAVTNAMGLSIKISTGSWDTMWNSLVSGQLDVLPIVAKLPERQRLVDFSLPHTETYDAFFVRKGDSPIPSIAATRGKAIVVMRSDAAHHELLERNFQGNLILVDTIPAGLSLISSGKHDAFLCSKLIGTMILKKHGLTGLTAGPTIPDYKRTFSFAVKKGDKELLEKLNQGLLIIKTNGEYDRIYDKWLSFDDPWRKAQKYLLPVIITVIAITVIAGFWLATLQLLVRKRTRELAEKNKMLHCAYDDLEARVQERTVELAQSNQLLQAEITERKHAEEKIQASLLEKETMLKEIHHRVKNNLQVISSLLGLQSGYLQDEQSRKVFQESQDRVRIMANIHTMLYQSEDLARVDFSGFIRDLVGRLQQSYGMAESPVEVHTNIADVSLTIETSIPCGLILNELVSNALKHAFPGGRRGEVNISMATAGDRFVLKVQDNGIGFPASVDFENPRSMGLELVNLLVGQMNGMIDLQVEGGAIFTITFPETSKGD